MILLLYSHEEISLLRIICCVYSIYIYKVALLKVVLFHLFYMLFIKESISNIISLFVWTQYNPLLMSKSNTVPYMADIKTRHFGHLKDLYQKDINFSIWQCPKFSFIPRPITNSIEHTV